MSTISLQIKEAKIVNTEYNKPEKKFDERTGVFRCLNFNIVPTISIKKPKTENEWDSKMFAIKCTIWNEKAADRFLKAFNPNQKNYITVLSSHLNNFDTEELQKTSNNGNDYILSAYSYLSATVNDFVITTKVVDNETPNGSSYSKSETKTTDDLIDDDVPF